MAKEAGYALPADTAITLGASAVPEPEVPPATTFQADGGPPPVSKIRAQKSNVFVETKSYQATRLMWLTLQSSHHSRNGGEGGKSWRETKAMIVTIRLWMIPKH